MVFDTVEVKQEKRRKIKSSNYYYFFIFFGINKFRTALEGAEEES